MSVFRKLCWINIAVFLLLNLTPALDGKYYYGQWTTKDDESSERVTCADTTTEHPYDCYPEGTGDGARLEGRYCTAHADGERKARPRISCEGVTKQYAPYSPYKWGKMTDYKTNPALTCPSKHQLVGCVAYSAWGNMPENRNRKITKTSTSCKISKCNRCRLTTVCVEEEWTVGLFTSTGLQTSGDKTSALRTKQNKVLFLIKDYQFVEKVKLEDKILCHIYGVGKRAKHVFYHGLTKICAVFN